MTGKVRKEEKIKTNQQPDDNSTEQQEETQEEAQKSQETEKASDDKSQKDKAEDETTPEEENQADPLEELRSKYEEKQKEADEYLNMLKRNMADFDNFRKRTAKEKESLFSDGYSEAVKDMLPVLDNLERAEQNSSQQEGSLYEGVKMVLKIYRDILEKAGVKEIEAQGVKFDPDYHNAILHVEDDSVGENIIVEVFQRGYIYNGKVIRHSLVKVAN